MVLLNPLTEEIEEVKDQLTLLKYERVLNKLRETYGNSQTIVIIKQDHEKPQLNLHARY